MGTCVTYNCPNPAEDEYHFYVDTEAAGTVEVVWELCETHCEFAIDVVELISNLETEIGEWEDVADGP